VATIVYSTRDRNGFFPVPVGIIRADAGLPAPGPSLPAPFSMRSRRRGAEAAGRGVPGRRRRAVDSPVRLPSAPECLRFEKESFGGTELTGHLSVYGVLRTLLPLGSRAETSHEVSRLREPAAARAGAAQP
jgi:hypothetical protein